MLDLEEGLLTSQPPLNTLSFNKHENFCSILKCEKQSKISKKLLPPPDRLFAFVNNNNKSIKKKNFFKFNDVSRQVEISCYKNNLLTLNRHSIASLLPIMSKEIDKNCKQSKLMRTYSLMNSNELKNHFVSFYKMKIANIYFYIFLNKKFLFQEKSIDLEYLIFFAIY